MKKNIYKLLAKINRTSALFSLIILLSCTYIVCVYKTVTIASHYEREQIAFSELQAVVGQKEHEYIQKTSTIDVETALALGYERSTGAVAYIDTVKDVALAVR
ncbi:MAG: hypothetical protein V4686_01350 [Patescibacteria group bacterium]